MSDRVLTGDIEVGEFWVFEHGNGYVYYGRIVRLIRDQLGMIRAVLVNADIRKFGGEYSFGIWRRTFQRDDSTFLEFYDVSSDKRTIRIDLSAVVGYKIETGEGE